MSSNRQRARARRRLRAFLTSWVTLVRSFYSQPIAWLALLVTSALLTYGGGAVMFWLHAIVRGEAGPAISDFHHWVLDSTLGFIALTPVLGLILPIAAWQAGDTGEGDRPRVRLGVYVATTTALFTLVTGPGPLLHNVVAGAGTPLAQLAARLFGEDEEAAMHSMHAPSHSAVSEGALQLAVGLPVYLACTWMALQLVRSIVRLTRRGRLPRPGESSKGGGRDDGGSAPPGGEGQRPVDAAPLAERGARLNQR